MCAEFANEFQSFLIRDVDEQQILRNRCAEGAAAVLIGEIGRCFELLPGQTAAQHGSSYVAEAWLPLTVNANVIAEGFVGHYLVGSRQERETQTRLQFGQKPFRSPSLFHEEILQAGAIAAFAQHLLIAEDLSNGFDHGHSLLGKNERIETNREMRFVGEASADAH